MRILTEEQKEKRRAKWRRWYHRNIDYQRIRERVKAANFRKRFPEIAKQRQAHQHLKREYGITLDEYNAMFAEQGKVCKICKSETPSSKSPGSNGWHVDHCHKTKVIRGILCQPCNHMLGSARDNPQTLRAAAEYIEGQPT
jgi:hypothetical protein